MSHTATRVKTIDMATALEAVHKGGTARRKEWDGCLIVRNATESDTEYINYPHENIMVVDCPKVECDCRIRIYNPTPADSVAVDWVIE